ncbi:MAG: hypothetical protein NTU63_03870 [Candidatus Pacearchaeota archaeon]|nr:hypothetical protein [Candidatus Pacearchaeota archaeon]
MTLVDLILIYTREDKEGSRRYRRLDTGKEIFWDSLEMLRVPPTILFPKKSKIQMNHQDKNLEANALLIGMKIKYQGLTCRLANYCRIRGPMPSGQYG